MKVNLTDRKIKSLKAQDKKYKVFDRSVSGLYLMVMPSGYKVFKLAYRIGKYQKESTLGEYPILPLADARSEALDFGIVISKKRTSFVFLKILCLCKLIFFIFNSKHKSCQKDNNGILIAHL